MHLTGKIALVTGAHRGIGLAIAKELAQNGATVIATDINLDHAQEISDFLKEKNLSGNCLVLDVTEQDSIDNALAEITKLYGKAPQILVNNAGITRDNLLLRMSDQEWEQVLNTNLTSVFKICRSLIRSMMKDRAGRIINIASMVGVTGNAGQTNYASAKAGVIAFTKSLAKEIGSRGITVNAIAPGFIETAMTQKLSPEHRANYLAAIPLGRAGTPEDIAKTVVFLASEAAAYITGETIHVNGGMYMD